MTPVSKCLTSGGPVLLFNFLLNLTRSSPSPQCQCAKGPFTGRCFPFHYEHQGQPPTSKKV